MLINDRESYDEDGAIVRVLEYSDSDPLDRVVIRIPLETETIQVKAYRDDELAYQTVFEERNMSFKPISVRGRGESSTLVGASNRQDNDGMSEQLQYALNAIGYAIVPSGRGWFDGD